MTWTNANSPSEERAFEDASDTLNQMLDRRVRVSTQMRITACVKDVLSFVPQLRELERAEVERQDALHEARMRGDFLARWDSRKSFEFAAALKAMLYFVRALQDAVYVALLEARGDRAGRYSSMNDCATNPNSPLHQAISAALPDYFGWFAVFRDLRNQMKLGAPHAFGFRGMPGLHRRRIILQTVDDAQRHVGHGREVSFADIDACLTNSAQLMQFAAEYVRTMRPEQVQ